MELQKLYAENEVSEQLGEASQLAGGARGGIWPRCRDRGKDRCSRFVIHDDKFTVYAAFYSVAAYTNSAQESVIKVNDRAYNILHSRNNLRVIKVDPSQQV